MADAYDEMERLMKEYEALAQSDLPAALEKMIDSVSYTHLTLPTKLEV